MFLKKQLFNSLNYVNIMCPSFSRLHMRHERYNPTALHLIAEKAPWMLIDTLESYKDVTLKLHNQWEWDNRKPGGGTELSNWMCSEGAVCSVLGTLLSPLVCYLNAIVRICQHFILNIDCKNNNLHFVSSVCEKVIVRCPAGEADISGARRRQIFSCRH